MPLITYAAVWLIRFAFRQPDTGFKLDRGVYRARPWKPDA